MLTQRSHCCRLHIFRSNSRKRLRSFVFSNNLHVGFLRTLLIINELWRFLKVWLPIFLGNLVFDFRVKALSVSAFCASFKCRLFHFWLQLFQILAAWGSRVSQEIPAHSRTSVAHSWASWLCATSNPRKWHYTWRSILGNLSAQNASLSVKNG